MEQSEQILVIDKDGVSGVIDRLPLSLDAEMLVRFGDDQEVLVPVEMLVEQDDGSYYLPISLSTIESHLEEESSQLDRTIVVPVIEEELKISKRSVEMGRVRITKRVDEREEIVDLPLLEEEVEVKRVPVNKTVETAPSVRYQGDTMIVPVLQEVIVVQKQLMLKEEVHITKKRAEKHRPESVTLREEEVIVERVGMDESE